jgi:subtilisin family serine protease
MTARQRTPGRPRGARIACLGAVAASLVLPSPPLASAATYVQQAPAGAPVRVCQIDTGVPEGTPNVVDRLTATGSLDAVDPHGAQMAAIMAIAYPSVQIIAVQKVDGRTSTTPMADVVDLCVSRSVSLIAMSFTLSPSGFDRAALQGAVDRARAAGVVLVAAAGNEGRVEAPANLAGVIGVGAVDDGGRTCAFSASGQGLVMALGCHVDGTSADGTSDAAAYVAGTAAALAGTHGLAGSALEQATREADYIPAARDTDTGDPGAYAAPTDGAYLWVVRRTPERVTVAVRGGRSHVPAVRVRGRGVGRRAVTLRVTRRGLSAIVRCPGRRAARLRLHRPSVGAGRALPLRACSP